MPLSPVLAPRPAVASHWKAMHCWRFHHWPMMTIGKNFAAKPLLSGWPFAQDVHQSGHPENNLSGLRLVLVTVGLEYKSSPLILTGEEWRLYDEGGTRSGLNVSYWRPTLLFFLYVLLILFVESSVAYFGDGMYQTSTICPDYCIQRRSRHHSILSVGLCLRLIQMTYSQRTSSVYILPIEVLQFLLSVLLER